MEKIECNLKKERTLYRELFLNAANAFKECVNQYKEEFTCKDCRVCCEFRYSKLPYEEITRLAQEENDAISPQYLELFVPYEQTPEHDYVKLIQQKHDEPVYFYYCKYSGDKNCERKDFCKNFPDSATTILPMECVFRDWQALILNKIKTEIEPDINKKMYEITEYRKNFQCKRCGICCNLASSEFSWEELKTRAAKNDEFAKQFISVFVPYENIEKAAEIYPEYVELLLSRLNKDENAYFYHCKYLQGRNVCPIYENRPQICRDFPDNPFSIIPDKCGYHQWREEVLVAAYTYFAMSQIWGFYQEKINAALR